MRNYIKSRSPSDRAIKWAQNLRYEDRLKVRELIFRLYSISEDRRLERGKQ